jgi:hypothetical protein
MNHETDTIVLRFWQSNLRKIYYESSLQADIGVQSVVFSE